MDVAKPIYGVDRGASLSYSRVCGSWAEEPISKTTRTGKADGVTGLNDVLDCIAARFGRSQPRLQNAADLRGLLSPIERRNGQQLAEAASRGPHLGPCDLHHETDAGLSYARSPHSAWHSFPSDSKAPLGIEVRGELAAMLALGSGKDEAASVALASRFELVAGAGFEPAAFRL